MNEIYKNPSFQNILDSIFKYCKNNEPSTMIQQYYLYYDGFTEPHVEVLDPQTPPGPEILLPKDVEKYDLE